MRTTTRTDAESLLFRAQFSAYYSQPAPYLRLLVVRLREVGTERKVYYRQAERALLSGSFRQIEDATAAVQGELNRRRQSLQQVREVSPLLLRAA